MKKKQNALVMFLIVLVLLLAQMMPVFASGGKVRGENGQGAVNQVQVKDPAGY